jgi:hypothetical protein
MTGWSMAARSTTRTWRIPETIAAITARRYVTEYGDAAYRPGYCAGRVAERPVASFASKGASWNKVMRQCRRKNGHGAGGLFCPTHTADG